MSSIISTNDGAIELNVWVSILVLLIVGGIAFAITRRRAAPLILQRHSGDDAIMSNSRAVFTGLALALAAVLTIGFTGMSM